MPQLLHRTSSGWGPAPAAREGAVPGPRRRDVVAVLVIGALAAAGGALLDWRLVVPLALGLPLATAVTLEALPRPGEGEWAPGPQFTGVLHSERWLALALVFGAVFANVGLIAGTRSVSAAAQGSASADNLIELAAMGMGTLTVLSALRQGWSRRVPSLAWLFVAFGALTLFSVLWSQLPLFSAARAIEFATLGGLAAYGALRASAEEGFLERLLTRTFRYLTVVVLLLVTLSLAQGGLDYPRFSFRGTNPNAAASLMLTVVLAVLFHPRRARITWPLPWWVLPPPLLFLVIESGSRAFTTAALAAAVAGLVVWSLRNARVGALGLSLGAMTAGSVAYFAADWVGEFFKREQSTETVRGLNGRLEVWEWVLNNPVGSEIWGVGVGAVRGGLPQSWNPENSHSSWIEILQTLGVIGLGLFGALVVATLVIALARRSVHGAWMSVFAAISSVTSVSISQPGIFLMLLTLCVMVLAVPEGAPATASAPRSPSAGEGGNTSEATARGWR